ncbi:MAG: hypothetical protein NUV80_05715, partial [Candidatus Berkelbacteria bacterium]|nr:hypothetical protein [Candidatus Berkelbacteria bacterium]
HFAHSAFSDSEGITVFILIAPFIGLKAGRIACYGLVFFCSYQMATLPKWSKSKHIECLPFGLFLKYSRKVHILCGFSLVNSSHALHVGQSRPVKTPCSKQRLAIV